MEIKHSIFPFLPVGSGRNVREYDFSKTRIAQYASTSIIVTEFFHNAKRESLTVSEYDAFLLLFRHYLNTFRIVVYMDAELFSPHRFCSFLVEIKY